MHLSSYLYQFLLVVSLVLIFLFSVVAIHQLLMHVNNPVSCHIISCPAAGIILQCLVMGMCVRMTTVRQTFDRLVTIYDAIINYYFITPLIQYQYVFIT